MMLLLLIASILVGGAIGAAAGWYLRRSSKSHPTKMDWKHGAVLGCVMGLCAFLVDGGSSGSFPETKNMTQVGDTNFEAMVVNSGKPVVVDFYGTWCGPCKILTPRLDALARDYGGKIRFVGVDVDKAPSTAAKYNVEGVPTVLFFRNGRIVDAFTGIVPEKTLRAHLDALTSATPLPATNGNAVSSSQWLRLDASGAI